jgi:PAP2 superfamily
VARVRHAVSRHDGLAQVAIVLAAVSSYELLRRAIRPNWPVALAHARDVVSWERAAHLGWEAPVQQAFLHVPDVVRALNLFYLAGHFVLTAVFFCWLYRRSRPGFRVFRNGFLIATVLALAAHWAFPTAPPRLAGVGIVDTLRRFSGINIGSRASSAFSNPVAAVPSLHVGWALGVGIGLAIYARRLAWKLAGAVYPFAVALTVVVTGNHFVLDTVAGMAVMALGLGAAKILEASRGGAVR